MVTSSLTCIHGQVTKHTTVKWPIKIINQKPAGCSSGCVWLTECNSLCDCQHHNSHDVSFTIIKWTCKHKVSQTRMNIWTSILGRMMLPTVRKKHGSSKVKVYKCHIISADFDLQWVDGSQLQVSPALHCSVEIALS